MPSIKPNLSNDLTSSIKLRTANIRLKPSMGFILLALGAMASALKDQPPIEIGPAKAAITIAAKKGATNTKASCMASCKLLTVTKGSKSSFLSILKAPSITCHIPLMI